MLRTIIKALLVRIVATLFYVGAPSMSASAETPPAPIVPQPSITLTPKDPTQDMRPIQGVVPLNVCDPSSPCTKISDPDASQAPGSNQFVRVSVSELQRWEEQQHNMLVWAIIATMVAVAFVLNNVRILLSSDARGRRLKAAAAPKEQVGYKLN